MPSLTFDSVDISYTVQSENGRQRVDAVKNVSLELPVGGTLGIAGESGSGKSTLAMSVLRLLPRNAKVSGKILLGDRDVLSLGWGKLRAVRWSEASVVFQGAMHSLNPVRHVGAQIAEALRLHRGKMSSEECDRIIADLLEQVDLPKRTARSYPHELSGGQKQRVMIAMALSCDPDLVIADEPTTALDVIVQQQVLDVLTARVAERQISLMMISHDLSVLSRVCERIAVMYRGEIVEIGPAQEIIGNPQHPHSKALAAAFPTIGDAASRMNPLTRHVDTDASAAGVRPIAPAEEPASSLGTTVRSSSPRAVGEAASSPRAVAEAVPSAGAGEVLLAVDKLKVAFHTRRGLVTAVDGVSLECRSGEITALVGQSGSGKTTLARAILGLQAPTRGRILFRGKPLGLRQKELTQYRRQVQLILQDPADALNPKQTVYESVAEGIRIHRLPGDERERVARALEQAELTPPEQYFAAIPQELSGGQLQRVVIAGALALNPQFLVADEPVASLDASLRGEILALLLRLKRNLGLGALVITHDLGVAWNIADRVLVIHRGELVESGPTEEVLLNPQHDYTRKLLAAVPTADAPARADEATDMQADVRGQAL